MNITFLNYLDLEPDLETRVDQRVVELGIDPDAYAAIKAFMHLLKIKDRATYDHSLRVGLLASRLGEFMHLDPKPMCYGGLLHDIGKAQTRRATLQKTDGWTAEDAAELKNHVGDGHRLLRDHFDFTAEVIAWHHWFQPNRYPDQIPESLHDYSEGTRVMIPLFGRLLSLCDVFDALHRVNSRCEGKPYSGEQIREIFLTHNPDQRQLILEAYKAGIFTTWIASGDGLSGQVVLNHRGVPRGPVQQGHLEGPTTFCRGLRRGVVP